MQTPVLDQAIYGKNSPSNIQRNKVNNNNNWFLQRKGIEPTQIPVTSWRAGSTLTVDSP